MATENGITSPYQGKDIVSKILVNTYREKSFSVYGIKDIPPIKDFLPTELPSIEASDAIADHIFLLEDDSIAILDYESKSSSENMIKYLGYVTRVARKYFKPGEKLTIRIIVVYTCDVETAMDTMDLGTVTLKIEQAFLSHIDGDAEYQKIKEKLETGQALSDEDLMRLVIIPLTKRGNEAKQELIDEVIETAKELKKVDDTAASFVLSAMFVATANFSTPEQKGKIKEVLDMTAIGLMYEEEKEQYGAYREAKGTVKIVENKMNTDGISAKEACDQIGIKYSDYTEAKMVMKAYSDSMIEKEQVPA